LRGTFYKTEVECPPKTDDKTDASALRESLVRQGFGACKTVRPMFIEKSYEIRIRPRKKQGNVGKER